MFLLSTYVNVLVNEIFTFHNITEREAMQIYLEIDFKKSVNNNLSMEIKHGRERPTI